jgi:hypothetical protein
MAKEDGKRAVVVFKTVGWVAGLFLIAVLGSWTGHTIPARRVVAPGAVSYVPSPQQWRAVRPWIKEPPPWLPRRLLDAIAINNTIVVTLTNCGFTDMSHNCGSPPRHALDQKTQTRPGKFCRLQRATRGCASNWMPDRHTLAVFGTQQPQCEQLGGGVRIHACLTSLEQDRIMHASHHRNRIQFYGHQVGSTCPIVCAKRGPRVTLGNDLMGVALQRNCSSWC